MSLIGLVMNLILAALLAAALGMGWRLNRRLKVLRDSHDGFAAAVAELNVAAQRAEQGLADLRAATDEATDLLSDRIEKGRALAAKLERLVREAPEPARVAAPARAAPPVTPPKRSETAEDRLGALLAAAREARVRPERPERPQPPERLERPVARQAAPAAAPPARRSADDDLFDDEPITLDRYAGARR